jgi:tetratricopeptide (TPR) repeat protein
VAAAITSSLAPSKYNDCASCQEVFARAYLLIRQKQKALDAIARAIHLDPNQYSFLMTRGRIYQRFENQAAAIESFLLADRLHARKPDTYYSLGMSFFMLQEYQRAAQHFRHVVELDARNDRAEFMLGVVESFNAKVADAKTHMERAILLQPGSAYYHLYYGIVLARFADDPNGARREMETAAKLDPTYAFTQYNLGRLHLQTGEDKAAKQELEEAVRLRPELARAWYQLATVYRRLGDPILARKALSTFVRLQRQEKEDLDAVDSALSSYDASQ